MTCSAETTRTQSARRRVLHITSWYPSAADPNAVPFIKDWVDISALDAEVRVVHLDRSQRSAQPYWKNDTTLVVPYGGGSGPKQALTKMYAGVRYAAALARTFEPHILHAHVFHSAHIARLISRSIKAPYVVSEHTSQLLSGGLRRWPLVQAQFGFRGAQAAVVVGSALRSRVEELGCSKVWQLPNPVDRRNFTVSPLTSDIGPRLLWVGRQQQPKDPWRMVRAFAKLKARLPQATLTMVGSGPCAGGGAGIDADVKDAIHERPRLTRPELATEIERSQIVVVSSSIETFSLVAAEAFSSGRPVVTTPCGGPEYFVRRLGGLVASSMDASDLAEAIKDCWSSIDEYDWRSKAEEAALLFDPLKIGEQLSLVYGESIRSFAGESRT